MMQYDILVQTENSFQMERIYFEQWIEGLYAELRHSKRLTSSSGAEGGGGQKQLIAEVLMIQKRGSLLMAYLKRSH